MPTTIRVYLRGNVCELDGFVNNKNSNGEITSRTFKGILLYAEDGRFFFTLYRLDASIPKEVIDFVEMVSCHDVFPALGHREAGIYRHETAVCELVPYHGPREHIMLMTQLTITAQNTRDIMEIMCRVKAGMDRPEESYEEVQPGMTRQQLEHKLDATQRQLDAALGIIDAAKRFVNTLFSENRRVIRRDVVTSRLHQILNGK